MAHKIKRLIPLFDRVLVEKVAPKKEIGGIILPASAQQKFNHGQVVEVGPGHRGSDGKIVPMTVKKGDFVMLGEWANTVKVNDKELYMVKEEEILGVVELEK